MQTQPPRLVVCPGCLAPAPPGPPCPVEPARAPSASSYTPHRESPSSNPRALHLLDSANQTHTTHTGRAGGNKSIGSPLVWELVLHPFVLLQEPIGGIRQPLYLLL